MTTIEKEKLEVIFHEKYMELAFEYNANKKTWQSYLESVKCTSQSAKWASMTENYYTKFDSLIQDPSPFGGYIQMSEETALKILTLGLP